LRTYYLILLFIVNLACSSKQLDPYDLYGNWQIMKSHQSPLLYQEIFIDSKHLYVYDENVGYNPKNKFFIKNDSLFTSTLGAGFKNLGKVSLKNEKVTFSLKNKESEVSYRRIDDSNVLQDLISEKITQQVFSESFFKRMRNFKK